MLSSCSWLYNAIKVK